MSEENLSGESSAFRSEALKVEALGPVAEIISEIRAEVSQRLQEAGAREFLESTRTGLETYLQDTRFSELAATAIRGLQAGLDWLDGKLDKSLFEAVVEVVAFALQVAHYIANGHYVGDLMAVQAKVDSALRNMYDANSAMGST